MRRLFVALALASVLALAVGASAASASTMPAEGIFEGCPLDTTMPTCLARLQVMHQGGVQVVVLPASSGSLSSLATYAAAAHGLGMSVMWAISDQSWWQSPMTSASVSGDFQEFSAACGCTENGALLNYMIHWLGSLPGTYGYYAADDSMLAPGDGPSVTSYVAQIKQQDPVHTVLIASANESQTNTYTGVGDLVGQEIYPVTTYSLMPTGNNQSIWGWVSGLASHAQAAAQRSGRQSAFILQAFSWGDNLSDGQGIGGCSSTDTTASCFRRMRYPSGSEQLALRNEILLHAHPKLILWWSFQGTYGQAGNDTYSMYPTGAAAASHWSGLSAAIRAPAPGAAVTHRRVARGRVARAAALKRARRLAARRRHHALRQV